MKTNPLLTLESLGQSIWLDYLARHLITSGRLKRFIDEDGLSGLTSNPSIFEKAILESHDYDDAIRALSQKGSDARQIYDALTVRDIQMAADLFRPIYDRTNGNDGFASLEVSPHLARDTAGSINEARRLWAAVNRPNVFIKIPATFEGLPAIQQLISEGININITLLFGLPRYRQVADAFLAGLEQRSAKGQTLERIASVASFFLSRIDVLVDPQLEKIAQAQSPKADLAKKLRGQIGIASAKMAYQIFKEVFGSERFQKLAAQGARPQRVLWASTGTKNPDYSDVKYIEPLIGPHTINTVPLETLDAYRDHGHPALTIEDGLSDARESLTHLAELNIDINEVTHRLENEGIEKFNKPFDLLLKTLPGKAAPNVPLAKA